MEKSAKKFTFPHEFIIIIVLGVLACILTYIIPAGQYERITTEAGTTVINPEVFQYIENTPVAIWRLPMLLVEGFYNSRALIFAIFIFTGSMQIVMASGTLQNLTSIVIQKFGSKQSVAVAVIMSVIAVLSSPMGYNPFIAFMPVGLLLAAQLGYDAVCGVAIICLAAAMGPNAGMLNPSTTGIGNQLAGLPTFYGFGYRLVGFALITAVTIWYVIRYGNKVKADPTASYVYGIPQDLPEVKEKEDAKLSTRQILVGITLIAGIILLIFGCTKMGWSFQEMSAFFLVFGPVCGFVYGMSPNEMCVQFTNGAKNVMRAALLIGMAAVISVILTNGNVLDTIVKAVSSTLNYLPAFLQAPGMLLIHTVVNFFITSGNGQAVVTMPIMLPVADIIGMSPETAILALNYGDGFTNMIFPHSSALMAFLALSNVPYHKWVKFVWKLLLLWYVIGAVLLMIAQATGY